MSISSFTTVTCRVAKRGRTNGRLGVPRFYPDAEDFHRGGVSEFHSRRGRRTRFDVPIPGRDHNTHRKITENNVETVSLGLRPRFGRAGLGGGLECGGLGEAQRPNNPTNSQSGYSEHYRTENSGASRRVARKNDASECNRRSQQEARGQKAGNEAAVPRAEQNGGNERYVGSALSHKRFGDHGESDAHAGRKHCETIGRYRRT